MSAERRPQESLEQQTATSEVLKAISRTTFDLDAVLRVLIENATRLAGAHQGFIFRFDGVLARLAYSYNAATAYKAFIETHPLAPGRGSLVGRVLLEQAPVHIPDVLADKEFALHEAQRAGGFRSMLGVPMTREDKLIGVIAMWTTKVRPFTDKQIELVANFAAQAVIAIENTRLLNELRESLEQQTATSEVLKVISSSPGELAPVFQALLENATRICGAKFGALWLREGELFRAVAVHGAPQAYRELLFREPIRPGPDTGLGQLLQTKQFVQIEDITRGKAYRDRDPLRVATLELAGGRTLAEVPLLKDGELIGSINIYRQEVRPFTGKQIELLQNFAAQAVIAVENTRLLNELRESLQRQTATSEVLSVISSSPGELGLVFQAMLANATRICEASFGNLMLYENGLLRRVALHNTPAPYTEFNARSPLLDPAKVPSLGDLVRTRRAIQVADMAVAEPESPLLQLGGARTLLVVPMLKDDALIGGIGIYRQEVRPFTDKQVELVLPFPLPLASKKASRSRPSAEGS